MEDLCKELSTREKDMEEYVAFAKEFAEYANEHTEITASSEIDRKLSRVRHTSYF
jgi:hypothetical protein